LKFSDRVHISFEHVRENHRGSNFAKAGNIKIPFIGEVTLQKYEKENHRGSNFAKAGNIKITGEVISQKQPNFWFTCQNLCVPCLASSNFLLINAPVKRIIFSLILRSLRNTKGQENITTIFQV